MFIYKIEPEGRCKQDDCNIYLDQDDGVYLYRSDYNREELKRMGLTLVGIRVDNTNVFFDGKLYDRWVAQREAESNDIDKHLGFTPSDKGNIVYMDKHKLKEK